MRGQKKYWSCKKTKMVGQSVPEQSSSSLTLVDWRQPGNSPHNSVSDDMTYLSEFVKDS
jgi:hypothetical protein